MNATTVSLTISTLSLAVLLGSAVSLQRLHARLEDLPRAEPKPINAPASSSGGNGVPDAELKRLKSELASLQESLAAVSAGAGQSGAVTKGDVRNEVLEYFEQQKRENRAKEAEQVVAEMTRDAAKHLKGLTASLGLDAAQQLQVKGILDQQIAAYGELHRTQSPGVVKDPQGGPDKSTWLEEQQRIDAEAENGIKGLLKAEQLIIYQNSKRQWSQFLGGR